MRVKNYSGVYRDKN